MGNRIEDQEQQYMKRRDKNMSYKSMRNRLRTTIELLDLIDFCDFGMQIYEMYLYKMKVLENYCCISTIMN